MIEQEWRLEGLGLLGQRLEARGIPYRRFRTWEHAFAEIALREWSGIVPLGGNAHAWAEDEHAYLRHERELLEEAIEQERAGARDLPGCPGARPGARAEVRATELHEVGWLEIAPTAHAAGDRLFGHLAGPVGTYQWHMDTFDIPPGAVRLAESPMFPNQAFRHGNAWGVQFHPEVDHETARIWIANHPGVCERLGIDSAALDAAVKVGAERDLGWRSELFDRFADLVAERELG